MKKADIFTVVYNADLNIKIYFGATRPYALVIVICFITVSVLAISLRCPELLADLIRWIAGKAINS